MSDYRPSTPFNVVAHLYVPTTETIKGVETSTYKRVEQPFFCNVKTFGGTERESNGMTVVENTAIIELWYDPQINADCRWEMNGVMYEILGTPENINMRNQYMKFKVRAIKGGA